MTIFWFLVIGLIAGWLAGMITKGRGFGLFINLVVGVLGALLGGFLFGLLGLSAHGLIGSLVMAVVGAVVLLFLMGMIKRA
ncbi:MAG: GlsB/YeaQ/YmgE family stress response membrane protein [Desulfomonilaceae bacterium]